MKTLSDRYDKHSLLIRLHESKFIGEEMPYIKYVRPTSISKSHNDFELLKSVFDHGDILHMTPHEIIENFRSQNIWLFTTDGRIMNIEDFMIEKEGEIVFAGEAFTGSQLLFSEVALNDSQRINVFYSDYKPLDGNENITSNINVDEDLKWLLE